jgi:secreted protein with Ig-like and vWFA domain
MSDDTKDNELQSWIEPELEARVVAWVLGEASEFETAELERIIAEKPELGIFKRRIETVHGLLGAASRMEMDPMRLAEERRRKLLERLGATGSGEAAAVVAMPEPKVRRRISWGKVACQVAACLVCAAVLLSIFAPSYTGVASRAAYTRRLAAEKMAEMAKEEEKAEALGPSLTMAGPISGPHFLNPVKSERLLALESLKSMARNQTDDLDDEGKALKTDNQKGAADFAGKSNDAGALAGATRTTERDVAQYHFEKDRLEHDYTPSDALGALDDKAEHIIAGRERNLQQQGQLAEKQLGRKEYEERDIPAASLPGAMEGRVGAEENLTTNNQVRDAEPRGGAANAPAALSGPNTFAGATTISGGGMAMGGAVAGEADANTVAAAEPMTPAAPVAATAAPAPQPMQEAASVMAAPAQSQMADLQQPAGQLRQHAAAYASNSAKNEFGMAREADATGTTVTAGQLAMNDDGIIVKKSEGSLGLTKDAFALSGPAQAAVDLPDSPTRPAQRPIGRLAFPGADEVSATDQPYSTFSLHVSDVSFLLAKAALGDGELPEPDSVRPEEFYNAFDYGDPAPGPGEKIACRIEQAADPLLQQRNLVRIAMKVAATGRGQGQPLRLTVLLDTSGSMEREDRAASVQRAMGVLTSLLGPNDAVTLIGFARQPRLLAEEVRGDQAGKLVDIVKRTPPEGGTNMEEAIKTASELALRHYDANGQNRVVMLTDGAANLGDADPGQLSLLVEKLRQRGVSFDACGVGADGLNDDVLEALTRKGGGRYYFLNKPEDADEGFARQLAGAFRPAAENVKMQVRFNPDRVGKYRLIGFEKHRLKQEDFRNDQVTAAQLAAEEAAVALYQVQVLPEGDGEIGEVFVRFRDPADGRMVEQSWTIPYDAQAPALDKAAPSMQLAATAALLAEKLHGGAAGDAVDLDALEPMAARLRGEFAEQGRVRDLVGMFEEARRMVGRK